MWRRLVIICAVVALPEIATASVIGAVTRGEAGAVEAEASRTQVQAERAAVQATPGQEAKLPTAPKKEEYKFQAGVYLGVSIGPRNTYNGAPTVYKGVAVNFSGGAATMLTEKVYFAGEVFLDDASTIREFPNPKSLRQGWSYGFDVIPGHMITKYVLGYVRLGVESTYFVEDTGSSTAWRVGVGAETNICGKWDLRGEYVFRGYKHILMGRPQTDQFNLGILYKFL